MALKYLKFIICGSYLKKVWPPLLYSIYRTSKVLAFLVLVPSFVSKVKAKLSDVKADLRNQVTKLKDLKERCKLSQTEQSEKMEQKISEIESQRNQREELLVNDFDNKFGQLKREMAEGDAVIMNNVSFYFGVINCEQKNEDQHFVVIEL